MQPALPRKCGKFLGIASDVSISIHLNIYRTASLAISLQDAFVGNGEGTAHAGALASLGMLQPFINIDVLVGWKISQTYHVWQLYEHLL